MLTDGEIQAHADHIRDDGFTVAMAGWSLRDAKAEIDRLVDLPDRCSGVFVMQYGDAAGFEKWPVSRLPGVCAGLR